jgi:type I restriction enzyme S subunit
VIDVLPKHLDIVKTVLSEQLPGFEVRAFGSRVGGRAARFSDLDLCVMTTEPIEFSLLGRVRDAFSESDLPFKVDVLDWAVLTAEFRKIVENRYEIVHTPQG